MGGIEVGVSAPFPGGKDPSAAGKVLSDIVEAGVDHLVVGDHVSFFGGFGVDGLVHATSLLVAQPSLSVHTSVYLLPLRHPVIVARQLSTISSIAPGRLVLGVGIGGEDRHEVASCGIDPHTRGRRMDECMNIVRRLQTGEPVSFDGEFFSIDKTVVLPRPLTPIPLIVGGRSEAAVRRAGRLGDGWLGIWVSPDRFARAVRQAEEEAECIGRGEVAWRHGMTVWCGFGDDQKEGTAAVSAAMETLYGLPFARFDRYVPRGTPAEVADALRPYVEEGCRTFNLLAQSREPSSIPAAAGEVRRLLNGLA
ncbi:MAG TPA: LLM class flavin-dependent oxidoreductase [Acidimicrobiales bacterium]|nr:LLM class flavin-dependent oxidoreductase [Acidimicrobiales bacterium]